MKKMDQSMWRLCARSHTKSTSPSLGAVPGVQWTVSIHSTYLPKSQSENKKLSWSVWIYVNTYRCTILFASDLHEWLQLVGTFHLERRFSSFNKRRKKTKRGQVHFRSKILKHPSIGEYWNISRVLVLPESVIFTFLRKYYCYPEAHNIGTQKMF